MNDEGINAFILLFMLLAFLAVIKSRKSGRRVRELQDMVSLLQNKPAAPPPALPGASVQQVERLEQRIRVLERIVTDKNYDLASQIEALRDGSPELSRARETEGASDGTR
jgi:hypothetical protein